MTRLSFRIALLLAALTAFGCDEGRQRPPSVELSIAHAAPSYGGLDFFRGATTRGKDVENLGYRGAGWRIWDADQYNMHVNAASQGIGTEFVAFTAELVPDNTYHIVITESGGELSPLIVTQPAFPSDATNAEVTLVNAGRALGAVDVYVEPRGTSLASATALGTVGFRDYVAAATREAAEHRIFVTAVGDPATVMFESQSFMLAEGRSHLILLTDGAGEGLYDLVAVLANREATGQFIDKDEQSAVRFVNAANNRSARDIYLDDDFSAPLVAGLAFGTASAFETIPPGDREFKTTPAGNPSVVEHTEAENISVGRRYTVLIGNDSDGLTATTAFEDRRALLDRVRLQFFNGASQFGFVEFILAEPGSDPLTLGPIAFGTSPSISATSNVAPGDYELSVIDNDTDTVLAGPIPVSLSSGGFYTVLALDAADGSTVDIELLDDFK